MNKLSIILIAIVSMIGVRANAQAPDYFKYQSIARNQNGAGLVNTSIGLRISIHDTTATGTIVYQETHMVMTNDFGLFNVSIGGGTPTIGSMNNVNWANGAKYMEIEADFLGGMSYVPFGTSQLLSVPYALYANSSGVPLLPNGTAVGNTVYWDGSQWVVSSANLYHAGSLVGIGTTSPLQKLDVNGNINIPADSAYMIDNRFVLRSRGTGNLYVGDSTGLNGTLAQYNTFVGWKSGTINSIGSQNTFVGVETGISNLDGHVNTFIGRRAGMDNVSGYENTFVGAYAGQNNTNGQHNSFLGVTTGNSNTTGEENTYLGAHAGYFSTIGSYNTFVGNFAGDNNNGGSYNTILGFEADLFSGFLNNAMALGYGAVVSADNSVVVGNSAVTSIGGQVGWSTLSDGRYKANIQTNKLGLEFINGLRTVNYNYSLPGQEGIRYTGLIAQEVEQLLNDMGTDFSGVVRPKSTADRYSIRYGEFVVPLIKAVQEQSVIIEILKEENSELRLRLEKLEHVFKEQNKN